MKLSKSFLNRLEDIFAESHYLLRYEKGSFKSGFCILKSQNVIIVNKYYPTEGKINVLIEILQSISINIYDLSEKNKILLSQITQKQLKL
jgi:hypothetical protein